MPAPRRKLRKPPESRRRQIFKAGRDGFIWFAVLWLTIRPFLHRTRSWATTRIKNLAQTRPIALGVAGFVVAFIAGMVAYMALGGHVQAPDRLLPAPSPAATSRPRPSTRPVPSPTPTTAPEPTLPPSAPPPTTSPPPPPTSSPGPPSTEPTEPAPPVIPVSFTPPPSLSPSPTPAPTPAPTRTCLFTPDGSRCQNPNGLIKNSKVPPGQTRSPRPA